MTEPTPDPPSTDAPDDLIDNVTEDYAWSFYQQEFSTDAPPPRTGLAEWRARCLAAESDRDLLRFEHRQAEAEAAALRLRLEAAEAALRAILQHRPVNEIAAYYMQEIAELALKPDDGQPPVPHLDRIGVLEAALRAVREVPLDPTRINKIVEGALNVERQPAPGGGGGEDET